MAPLEEMLLQSWDGSLRIFPCWRGADVSFANWRAEGAFLVSGAYKDGKVASVTVESERGSPCVLTGRWIVKDAAGNAVATEKDEFGRQRFKTTAGGTYRLWQDK